MLDKIVSENTKDDFLSAQEELTSEFKRKKYIEDNFKFIPPKEIILNPEEVKAGLPKDCFHYISLLDSLKVLGEDDSFQYILSPENQDLKDSLSICDLKDGNVYRMSPYFRKNPDALALLLYSDAVEVTNPLSFGKGKHKLVSVYWQIGDVPRHQRSQINRLQLAMVFKESLTKKYSQHDIFKYLVEDLIKLECDGIAVSRPTPKILKCGLLLYSGDNLGMV